MLDVEENVLFFLQCEMCKSKLNEAKILPCGHFCKNCVDQLIINLNNKTKRVSVQIMQ